MIVRELLASFGLKLDESSFKKADSLVNSAKEGLRSLVEAFAIYEVAKQFRDLVESTIEAAAAIDDMANKIGITAQALQELRFAAKLSGIDAQEFDHALTILTKTSAEAAQGNEEAAKTFAQFGVKVRDGSGQVRAADAILTDIADKIQGAKTQTERLGIAVKFFGERQGSKFALLMRDGAAGIQQLRDEANALGGVMDKDMIANAAQADDNFDRLRFTIQGVKNTIVGALLPAIVNAQERMIKWVKANKDLIQSKVREWTLTAANAAHRFYVAISSVIYVTKALIDFAGGLRNVLIALGAVFGVYLLSQIGAAVIALAAFDAAETATKLLVLGDAILMGAVFVALAAIIFMVGEEIVAAFDPDKLGLFEAMRGQWGTLADRMISDAESTGSQFKKIGDYAVAAFALAVGAVDSFSDSVFNQFTIMGTMWDDIVFAIENAPTRIASAWRNFKSSDMLNSLPLLHTAMTALPGPSASPAVQAAAGQKAAAPSTSVSVSVDASGQTFNESSLAAKIGEHVHAAITDANRAALEALTPAGAR